LLAAAQLPPVVVTRIAAPSMLLRDAVLSQPSTHQVGVMRHALTVAEVAVG